MARKTEEKVSLNTRRLKRSITAAGYKSNHSFKTAIDTYYKNQGNYSAGVSNAKINDALQNEPITLRSAQSIASFLNVDLEYLTGDQLRPSKEESQRVQSERAALMNSVPILQAADLVTRYGWHIVFNDPAAPTTFSIYDPEDTLICSQRDIKDLHPFVEAAQHLLQLEEDITYNFLGNLRK